MSVQKDLVKAILSSPHELEWQVQGLGMLRTYLSKERRLHIWHSDLKFDGVSEIHTHPWNFKSYVVAGIVRNQKSIEVPGEPTHFKQGIFCGVGGGLEGAPTRVRLEEQSYQTYSERESYSELAHEIHVSVPEDGTVTMVKREFLDDVDHAYVYWEDGEWGSAEPREATKEEITKVCSFALWTWFDG